MQRLKIMLLAGLFTVAFLIVLSPTIAQQDKSNRPSPPKQVSGTVDGVNITIDYSSPAVKNRTIFGGLESYGKVWRAGANEATWIEVSDDVKINGELLPKGKYAFFIIPNENQEWTIIFNSKWDQWGAYNYDESLDVLRVDVKPTTVKHTERLEYTIAKNGKVTMNWSTTSVPFRISSK
ncbi:MAG: DUF2911 domain-containing protein [Cyclobacteriaceae bacterium]